MILRLSTANENGLYRGLFVKSVESVAKKTSHGFHGLTRIQFSTTSEGTWNFHRRHQEFGQKVEDVRGRCCVARRPAGPSLQFRGIRFYLRLRSLAAECGYGIDF